MKRLFKIIMLAVCIGAIAMPTYGWDNFRKALGIDGSISFSLIPATDNTFDMGSATKAWKTLYLDTSLEVGHATDTTVTRASAADINIEGNIVYRAGGTDVPVTDGGSGAGTFTDGGILLGSGTGAFTVLGAAANGQIPVGDGTTDPVLATITGTANEVVVTNGAGTITLSAGAALSSLGGLTETNGGIAYGTADNTYAWLAAGANTTILVGGGAAAPVWTTASGTGAPMRGTSPTFVTSILATNAAGPSILDEAATSTNPTLIPNRADPDTGIGWSTTDQLSLIVGATEILNVATTGVSSNLSLIAAGSSASFIATNTITSGEFNALQARGRATAVGASTAEVRGVYARGTVNDNLYGGSVTALQTETIAKTGSTVVNLRGVFSSVDSEGTPSAITNLYGGYFRVKTSVAPATDFYAMVLENELFGGGVVADAGLLLKGTGHFVYGIDMNSSLIDTAEIRGSNGEIIDNITDGVWEIGGVIANTPGTQTVTTEADMADPLGGTVMLITGDNDSDSDTIQLQDGTTTGQMLYIIAEALIDADDTMTIDTTTDSTCTNCSAIVFNKIGENAQLIWTGTTWALISLQTGL